MSTLCDGSRYIGSCIQTISRLADIWQKTAVCSHKKHVSSNAIRFCLHELNSAERVWSMSEFRTTMCRDVCSFANTCGQGAVTVSYTLESAPSDLGNAVFFHGIRCELSRLPEKQRTPGGLSETAHQPTRQNTPRMGRYIYGNGRWDRLVNRISLDAC